MSGVPFIPFTIFNADNDDCNGDGSDNGGGSLGMGKDVGLDKDFVTGVERDVKGETTRGVAVEGEETRC